MKLQREKWTPLTIVIETPEEAEVLHKILGLADHSEVVPAIDLYGLFLRLGEGLSGDAKFAAEGNVSVWRI